MCERVFIIHIFPFRINLSTYSSLVMFDLLVLYCRMWFCHHKHFVTRQTQVHLFFTQCIFTCQVFDEMPLSLLISFSYNFKFPIHCYAGFLSLVKSSQICNLHTIFLYWSLSYFFHFPYPLELENKVLKAWPFCEPRSKYKL